MENFVSSEVGTINKILIHSPDGGIGKIIPSKFKDWLYDDTVQLSRMQEEYDEYIMLLLYFMDEAKAVEVNKHLANNPGDKRRDVFKPDQPNYFNSDRVVDVQKALSDILEDEMVKVRLVSAICAVEGCSQQIQNRLEKSDPIELSKILITGVLEEGDEDTFIFPPVPNLVFTRDIGIMVKDHILLSKSATLARKRESLIATYISLYHNNLFSNSQNKIIEIKEESDFFLEDLPSQKENTISIEGGDIMMISEHHLVVGCSERTTKSAADAIIHRIFSTPSLEIEKISIVRIPPVRAQMHIDTIFTQLKAGAWVMYDDYSEKIEEDRLTQKFDYTESLKDKKDRSRERGIRVFQFHKPKEKAYNSSMNYFHKELDGLEDLLRTISIEDFGVPKEEVKVIYSANNVFPHNKREQWTDSCNLLALKDGLVIGYDRNEKTIEAFKDPVNGLGFDVVHAKDLLPLLEKNNNIREMKDTLILLSCTELSRARGGSHCMSMPLNRDVVK